MFESNYEKDYLISSTGFLRDIHPGAREKDVELAITNVLHGRSFAEFGSKKVNFHLQLHREKRGGGRSRGGMGTHYLAVLKY